ncbi:MAG TPA: N-acetylmuramoyl-L-alanine amidase family protein [Bacillota bacterium]|nr:N-acetylmuramoyl-L-alanine amidase family protein [Bacillota bacterium]
MKKLAPLSGAVLFLWILCLSVVGYAESSSQPTVQLIIEGNQISSDVPPKLLDGHTYVPIRVIANNFNSQVGWDNDQRKVSIQGDGIQLTMQIGNPSAVVNGKEVTMEVPPMIDGGRTLVPLRFVGESMGTNVGWEQESQTVIINKNCSVNFGNSTINSDIYKLNGDLYLPLKQVAQIAGVTYPGPTDDQKITLQGQQFDLDKDAKAQWNLRKIGANWYIPLTMAQKQFQPPAPPANQPTVPSVDPNLPQLTSVSYDNNRVTIKTTKPVTSKDFTLTDPNRVVVDLPNAVISDNITNSNAFVNGLGTVPLPPIAKTMINQIRYSQFDTNTVRIVIELNQKPRYKINTTVNGLEVIFQPAPPKTGYLVVLDAGHGGKDTGAVGITGNYEKDITLSVEKLVKAELLKYKNFQVVETRSDDSYPTLQDRVDIAQNANADLFLSIHCNSFDPDARGTETYYETPQSAALAQTVHKHLLAATGFPDRGTKTSDFYVITNTTMPSNLVELGFITNAEEDKQLLTPEVQQRIAKSLADAIYEYYNSNN